MAFHGATGTSRDDENIGRARSMPPVTHSSESHVDRDALSCAIDAADLGTWRIDMTTDRALDRSEHHDRLFGHAAPQPDWGFAAAARQVIDEDRPAFLAALAQARATGVLRCAVRVRWPDGSVHGLEFRGRTIRGAEDDQGVMAGTVADVGDSPAIEIRLRESELRLRLAQTLSDMGLFDWDIPGGRVSWSDELLRIYGIGRAEFDGRHETWRPWVLPEDLSRLEATVQAVLARRDESLRTDFRIRRPDGEVRELECVASFTYGPDGTALRGIGVNRDVTEARRMIRALGESEARDRAIFEQAAVGIVDADLDGRWVRANRRLATMLGYDSPDDLVGKSWVDLTHPDDRATGRDQLAALRAGRVTYHTADKRFLRKDGSAIWASATVSLVRAPDTGQPSSLTSVIVDATDRKKAEASVAEAEERLRFAQAAAGAGLWNLDIATGVATCSEGYCRLYGLDPLGGGHRTTEDWLAQVHPADRVRARAAVETSLTEGAYACEYRIVRTDGAIRWLAARGKTYLDEAGRPRRFTGLAVDVTALREAELRLRMAIEGTGLATWERVVANGSAHWSANHFPLFGYPTDPGGRASYDMWWTCIRTEDRAKVQASVAQCRDGERFDVVYRIRRADDGAERWMQTMGYGIDGDAQGHPRRMIGISLDVTDREVARARLQGLYGELLHVSRLADAGVMASGLVHEVAQPLTAATSAVQAAKLTAHRAADLLPRDLQEGLEQACGLVEGQLARAGEILEGLRAFIIPHGTVRSPEALRPLVDDACILAMVGFGRSRIEMRNAVPDGLPDVLVNAVQIRQLLFNLLRNAIQALAERGAASAAPAVTVTAYAQDDVVTVQVTDNGPGLAPEVAAQLFEPFVTTKPDGMGIGLSLCRSIVEAHGGSICAEANPGGGVAFRFTLPVTHRDEAARAKQDEDGAHDSG